MIKAVVFGSANGIGLDVYAALAYDREVEVVSIDREDFIHIDRIASFPLDSEEFDDPKWSILDGVQEVYITIGKPSGRAFANTTAADEYLLMATNFHAVSSALKLGMKWGRETTSFVVVASVSGMTADAGGAVYGAAKAGLIGLVRNLAREWAPMRINAVAPGPTSTCQFLDAFKDDEDALKSEILRSPHARLIQPIEVADAMISLCRLTGVSGVTLPVDLAGVSSSRQ